MNNFAATSVPNDMLSYEGFRNAVLHDYRIAFESRETSLLGRKEVLTGKAKFGIFGDGKEVAQVAMAKFFKEGDFRSGYYRDQTFQFAIGQATVEQFFAQLYADPDEKNDPNSAGRQMVSHFCTSLTDEQGNWLDLANRKNTIADLAPTAGQMPRGLGVALASKCFRGIKELKKYDHLSDNGNEVCFVTIGDAATSEGHFWETINAAGVMQVPMALFVWDDGYGISVPKKLQTTKASISEALSGFQKKDDSNGFHIYKIRGWDYAGMCEAFEEGIRLARETHTPALFHVEELTQPQGHSTSGSHERYKTPERLEWEREHDCLKKMREWVIDSSLASDEELNRLESKAKNHVKDERTKAWEKYQSPIKEQVKKITELATSLAANIPNKAQTIEKISKELSSNREPMRREVMKSLHSILRVAGENDAAFWAKDYYNDLLKENELLYNSHLYNVGEKSALKVIETKAVIAADAPMINGFEVLNKYFDALFSSNPLVVAFGEDVGKIGDVNQGFSGLQAKYGEARIFDCGIRELTIMGQGIGIAMRGLRPIAEIQYLDYLLYGLEPLSDDAATLHFRTKGIQHCPIIVRTRGHRLEGIWHSGSPMSMILGALRGMNVCVPRNMVQAAGMYNSLLAANEPALVIESLNGYRLKEKLPQNLDKFTVPLGIPEVLHEGSDITIVSYGSTLRIIEEAITTLSQLGVSCELIDV